MKFRSLDHSFHKSAAFAVLHLVIAVGVGWLLTGSFVLAGLITLIEPALNTVMHHRIDRWWEGRHGRAPSVAKTALFAGLHFVIAVAVAWALTGSLAIAGALAVVEPLVNAVALYFFDRWWARRDASVASLPAADASAVGAG